MTTQQDMLAYYAAPGLMTEPGPHADLLAGLPSEMPGLVRAIQGAVMHVFWTKAYGIESPGERANETNLRRLDAMLGRIHELDDRPLVEPRPLDRKLIHNCRGFSTLLAGLLRAQGVPARARCGFGTYFTPDDPTPHYEDHWVAEYWHTGEGRWVMVDAQLDAVQQEGLRIDFDPLDMPPGRFITGGVAWQMITEGEANPDHFGIFDLRGVDFVKGNALRDLAALNKVEVLPWDGWGLIMTAAADFTPEEAALMNRAAALAVAADDAFDAHRALFEADARIGLADEARLDDLRAMA